MSANITRGTSLFALGIMLVNGMPAIAQTQTQRNPGDSIEEIIVTGQQARKQVESSGTLGVLGKMDPLSTPFNVSSYTAQLILDQQSETIGAVLQNDPAVRMSYGFGNQSEQFVIRGFTASGDDVSIEGLHGIAPRQLVSPELFGRVQVLNGASAFLFGAAPGGSGIGGSIDLTPKRAEDKPLARATLNYIQRSILGGNFDVGERYGSNNQFGVRVNGVFRKGQSSIDGERREVHAASVDLDYRMERMRFFVDVGYEFQRADQPRPIVQVAATTTVPLAPPNASGTYGQPWTYTRLEDLFGTARAEYDLVQGVTAYITGGFRSGREDGDYSSFTVTNGATGAGTQARLFVPRQDHNQAAQAGIRGSFNTGALSHSANAGVEAEWLENRNSFSFGSFPANIAASATAFFNNIYTPIFTAKPVDSTLPASGGSLINPPKLTAEQFRSAFASDTIGIFDDKVQVTGGVRQQTIAISSYSRATFLRTSYYNATALTPIVGVIYRPLENFSVYANRIEALTQGPTAPNNATTTNPGQVFPPFQSVQYEVGAKWVVSQLTATVALFQTEQPSAFAKPVTGSATLTTFVLDGQQRNRGIELSLNGELSPNLRLISGLSLTDAKQTHTLGGVNDGKRAVGVAEYQLNLGVEVVPPFLKNATFTARMVNTGNQMINVTNTGSIPAWTRFDLGVRYVSVMDTHPVTFRVGAENVFDKSYWASAFGGYLYQAQPLTMKASITFEY